MNFVFILVSSQKDDMLERNCDVVTLHDLDPSSLKQLVDYAYSGEITITEENVQVSSSSHQFIQI
jgi:kelch-like protein 17 (actinfilin)